MPIYAIFAAQLFGLNLGTDRILLISLLGVIIAAGVTGIYRLINIPNTMLNVTGNKVGMVTTVSLLGTLDRNTFDSIKK